ncbi:unnamed protein product [Euphydryas editha]|uniref:Mononegavirales mRNA-capping domain-containing protein n=1 Tax=Euphydryas editha TaxID=104508 RepID=A0AAU9TNA6_EUPED|nr:unnamed protein product [Euphydryas editha]
MVRVLFGTTGTGRTVAFLSAAMLNLLAWSEMNHMKMIQEYLFGRFPELLAMKQLQGPSTETRLESWGFPITGITSPVPCEQIRVIDYDSATTDETIDCIIVMMSYMLQTLGKSAFLKRGPFDPYLGSTPQKIIKPKLTVVSLNPIVKSVTKLYYILTYLWRMDDKSALKKIIKQLIDEKLKQLPKVFQETPLEHWCEKNYGGSYEHRNKEPSQKK